MMRGNVKALVDQYADSIIKAMLSERMMGIKDFRTSYQPRFVNARTEVIQRLHDEGFSSYAISRILKMNRRTVEARFNPRIRERNQVCANRYQAKREQQGARA